MNTATLTPLSTACRGLLRWGDLLAASEQPIRGDASTQRVIALLWRVTVALVCMALLSAGVALFDERTLGAYSVWTKPLKFQLSLAVQTASFAWALNRLSTRTQRAAMPLGLAWFWVAMVAFEACYITFQGARGVASHFNRATPMESAAATGMAIGAGLLVSVTVWIGFCALWQSLRDTRVRRVDPTVVAIGLGFVLGGVLAGTTGGAMGAIGGYWPAPLNEPVMWMPLTGWVLSQADLRIAHFAGLHQMQALPLLAATAAWAKFSARQTLLLLGLAALLAPLYVAALSSY